MHTWEAQCTLGTFINTEGLFSQSAFSVPFSPLKKKKKKTYTQYCLIINSIPLFNTFYKFCMEIDGTILDKNRIDVFKHWGQ